MANEIAMKMATGQNISVIVCALLQVADKGRNAPDRGEGRFVQNTAAKGSY
ncbi:MAG: hypothetical protein OHK0021_20080 [Bryobacter sp.]